MTKPITTHQFSLIKTLGILSGSRAFGTVREDSDHDYIIKTEDIRTLALFPDNYYNAKASSDQAEHSAATSIRVLGPDDEVINLLVKDDDEYRRWVEATKCMKVLVAANQEVKNNISNKAYRVKLFQLLRGYMP